MAVEGFEEYTHELTESELKLLPSIIFNLKKKIGKENAITNSAVCKAYKSRGKKMTQSRFRKIIGHIRTQGLIFNLIATSKGYHVAETEFECDQFIKSLDERINKIMIVRDAMFYQKNQMFKKEE